MNKDFQLTPVEGGKSIETLTDPFLSSFNVAFIGVPRAGKTMLFKKLFMDHNSIYSDHFNQVLYVTRNIEDLCLKREIESAFGENGFIGYDQFTNLTDKEFQKRMIPCSCGNGLIVFDDYLTSGRRRLEQSDFMEHLAKTRAHILGEDSNTSVLILGHSRVSLPPGLIECMNQLYIFKGSFKTFKEATDLYLGLKPKLMTQLYNAEYDEPYSFIVFEIGRGGVSRILKGVLHGDTGVLNINDISDRYLKADAN